MKTEIIRRNTPMDDRLRGLVDKKLSKLEPFLDGPVEARVTLTTEKHSHLAELYVTHRSGVLQGTEHTGGTFQEAVQRAGEKGEEPARRTHQKTVDKRRRTAGRESRDGRW